MDPNTLALLQAIAAFLQVLVASVALPVTAIYAIRSAREGARQAYELGEASAHEREMREQARQSGQQQEQINSLRLLLGLEIQRNLNDLQWLRDNLTGILGEDDERYYQSNETSVEDKDKFSWFEVRQRFLALYMPDWSHRVWYSQQSSYLIPAALNPTEISDINYIHSQFDRLSKIKNMLTERVHNSTVTASLIRAGGLDEKLPVSSSFNEDIPRLWHEFNRIVSDVLALSNPLKGSDKEDMRGDYVSQTSGNSHSLQINANEESATKSLKKQPVDTNIR